MSAESPIEDAELERLTPKEAKAVRSFLPSITQTWAYEPEFGTTLRSAMKKIDAAMRERPQDTASASSSLLWGAPHHFPDE